MQKTSPHQSSLGKLNANQVAALCYGIALILLFIRGFNFCAWLIPLAVYVLEKESPFVKFHAYQAFLLNVSSAVLQITISVLWGITHGSGSFFLIRFAGSGLTLILSIANGILSIVILIYALMGTIKSIQYEYYKMPIIGDIANQKRI